MEKNERKIYGIEKSYVTSQMIGTFFASLLIELEDET